MQKKILLTGSNGGLGAVLKDVLREKYTVVATNHSTMSIIDAEKVDYVMASEKPDIVIHCAAIVNADQAENNKELTYETNVVGTEIIAKACRKYGAGLVFFSSDYVFNGLATEPYKEDSLVDPIQYYGVTKVLGEQIVRDIVDRYLIIRVSWLFGPEGTNFLQKILNRKDTELIRVVDDQIGSPTYVPHLSRTIMELIDRDIWNEVLHISSEGYCTWAEYAEEILRLAGSKARVVHVKTENYPGSARRPMYSILSKEKLYAFGIPKLPNWDDALKMYFEDYQ